MGEVNSKSQINYRIGDFIKEFTLIKSTEDQRTGFIDVYQSKMYPYFIGIKKNYNLTERNIEEITKKLDEILSNNITQDSNILQLMGYHTKEAENQFCSTDLFEISIFYQYLEHNLGSDIQRRALKGLYFLQEELWLILYSLINAAEQCRKIGTCLDDVQPSRLSLTTDGKIKVLPFGWNIGDTYLKQRFINYGETGYIAPEVLRGMIIGSKSIQNNETMNRQKSDVWMIGLTVLECANLMVFNGLYDFTVPQVNQEVLERLLSYTVHRYSSHLNAVIRYLVQIDEHQRPSLAEVQRALQCCQYEIQNLLPIGDQEQMNKAMKPIMEKMGEKYIEQKPQKIITHRDFNERSHYRSLIGRDTMTSRRSLQNSPSIIPYTHIKANQIELNSRHHMQSLESLAQIHRCSSEMMLGLVKPTPNIVKYEQLDKEPPFPYTPITKIPSYHIPEQQPSTSHHYSSVKNLDSFEAKSPKENLKYYQHAPNFTRKDSYTTERQPYYTQNDIKEILKNQGISTLNNAIRNVTIETFDQPYHMNPPQIPLVKNQNQDIIPIKPIPYQRKNLSKEHQSILEEIDQRINQTLQKRVM